MSHVCAAVGNTPCGSGWIRTSNVSDVLGLQPSAFNQFGALTFVESLVRISFFSRSIYFRSALFLLDALRDVAFGIESDFDKPFMFDEIG